MLALLVSFLRNLARPANDGGALPRELLAAADGRAGRDPRQARELRRAAFAAFRVVR